MFCLYRLYKNKIEEKPGWNDQVLRWCLEAAQERGLRTEVEWGGFLIDEMKIQVGVILEERLANEGMSENLKLSTELKSWLPPY